MYQSVKDPILKIFRQRVGSKIGSLYGDSVERVNLSSQVRSFSQVVAKIFDPLFVPVGKLPDIPAKFRQAAAFQCCEREVADYSSLTSLQCNAVPKFYGELSHNFPHRSTESDRIAKVIFMEYMDGWPLSWYSREELTASQGRWIMQQTEAIAHQIHCHGVIHHDSFLRNFLVTKLGRVVIVDFEESEISDGHNRYSPEILKKGDLMVLHGEFEDLGLLPRDESAMNIVWPPPLSRGL